MTAFLDMSYINEQFTNPIELDDFLNLSVDLIERTREQIKSFNSIDDPRLRDEVKKHIVKNLTVIYNGLQDSVLSINGDLVLR